MDEGGDGDEIRDSSWVWNGLAIRSELGWSESEWKCEYKERERGGGSD